MGTRGNFEESLGEQSTPGCYIGGMYNKERISYLWKRVGFPTFANSVMHTVNRLAIEVTVAGEAFDMSCTAKGCSPLIQDIKGGKMIEYTKPEEKLLKHVKSIAAKRNRWQFSRPILLITVCVWPARFGLF